MYGVWTVEQGRAAEEVLLERTPEGLLMRRAARGVATRALAMLAERAGGVSGRRVVVLAGAGNNGGDGLWAGYEMRRRGVAVTAVLLSPDRAHPAGLAALRRAGGRVVTSVEAGVSAVDGGGGRRADLVVDAIVGTSARGGLRPEAAVLAGAADAAGVPILAVDQPSGVDPHTGVPGEQAVTAAATVTFGTRKPVHVLAAPHCGPVDLVDLWLGPELPAAPITILDTVDVGAAWPVPGPADDKYSQGVLGVAAGSATYPGAAVLASGAAALSTSGMVRYAGTAADEVRAAWPEVIATDSVGEAGRVQAWAVGPGLGTDQAGADTLATVLDAGVRVLADADAVTLLGADADLRAAAAKVPTLITPHAAEFARIAELDDDRVDSARRAADDLGVTVLLKGNATVVAAPGGPVLVHPAGTSWLASAGSGDVLSGVAGALLAAGLEPWRAGACAAHVHALAAEHAALGGPPGGVAARSPATPGSAGLSGAVGSPVPASSVQAALPGPVRAVRSAAATAPGAAR